MLTMTALLIVAIILSLVGKKGQKVEFDADEIEFLGHKPSQKDIRRVEEGMRHRKKLLMVGAGAVVVFAMLVDWSSGGNPFSGSGAKGGGWGRAPGLVSYPGWQAGGVAIPPQGFSGRMLVRFENGEMSGGGFMIVAPGVKRKFGWRVVGDDAPSCMLRLDFKGAKTYETGWLGGYTVSKEEFGEGEHEASFTAWCPHGQNNVDFQFATMTTGRDDQPVAQPSWKPASGADIRHHDPQ